MTADKPKKIAIFAGDNLTAHLAVNRLVPAMLARGLSPDICITKMPDKARVPALPPLQNFAFHETGLLGDTIYPFLEKIPAPIPADKNPRHLAREYGISFRETENINDPAFVNSVTGDEDLIGGVSIRNLQIFREDIIGAFRAKGFLWNLHVGILPAYRGVFIPPRAIMNGEKEYGWTLHHVDRGIDTGNIIDFCTRPLQRSKTMLRTYTDFIPAGVDMIVSALDAVLAGKAVAGYPQQKEKGNYYSFPSAAELALWREWGISLADPVDTADICIEHFSSPGSPHAFALKGRIIQAFAEREPAVRRDPARPAKRYGQ